MTQEEQKMKAELQKGMLYSFLIEYINEHQHPPTLKEMGEAIGKKDYLNVERILARLEAEGLIEIDQSRTQRAVKVTGYRFVPVE